MSENPIKPDKQKGEKCDKCQTKIKTTKEWESYTFYNIYSEKPNPNAGKKYWNKDKDKWEYEKDNIRVFDIYLCEKCWKDEQSKYLNNKKYGIHKELVSNYDNCSSSSCEEIQRQEEFENGNDESDNRERERESKIETRDCWFRRHC